MLLFLFNPLIYLNIFPGKKKDDLLNAVKKGRCILPPLSFLASPSCLEDVGVTRTVNYGMDCKTSVMFRGGGTGCSALHGNQRKALSVELNLHSKSPYSAAYHTWEREQ